MRTKHLGFSLLELLVVLAVVAILTSFSVAGIQQSRADSRDAKRQADLILVQNAVELFKNKYGQYPAGCNGPTLDTTTNWSGETGTGHECGSGNEYIVGLAPEFIPSLPRDPRAGAGGANSGYVYTTNEERSVFKFMALNSVESEVVDNLHEFYRCDPNSNRLADSGNPTNQSWLDPGICFRGYSAPGGGINANRVTIGAIPVCSSLSEYGNDYAVSAGFSSDTDGAINPLPDKGREYDTEIVRCR